MNRSVRVGLGIVLALVLVTGAGATFVWWKVSGLKEILVRDLGTALGAQVQVTSLDLDLWKGELHAAGISLINAQPSAPWEKGEISQATVHFHLTDLLASTLPLSVEVSSWSVDLHPYPSTPASSETASTATPAESTAPSSSSCKRIQVTALSARDGSVEIHLADNQKVDLHGVAFEAGDNGGGVWTTQLQAASLVAGSLQAGASSIQIRGETDKITFSNLRMACDPGVVTGDGDVALSGQHDAHITLRATDVPVTMLVAVNWQMKLSGFVTGSAVYTGNDQDASTTGQLALNHGKFNVLPWLGKVTSLVGLPDISDVEVDKATSDFAWKDHTFHLTNLDIRKTDVVRIAGNVDIDPTGQIDGKLKLGLPSTITAKWPQLQDKIFSVPFEDYNWADVHLTGSPDHLQEDLTPRLLAAGMDTGGGLLNQAAQKATDLFKSFMGK